MQNITGLKKVVIIIGGFGSGKSEYAINLALDSVSNNKLKTALVDLDLVNAYFRSREAQQFLEKNGIKMIVPPDNIRFSDLPISGPGISELIRNNKHQVIVDVGGDDMGATALGTYREDILKSKASILMVVNPFRPFTRTVEQIEQMKVDIEYSSGISVNGFISNPNIGSGTSLEQVLQKHEIVKKAGAKLNLPVLEMLILKELYQANKKEIDELGIPVRPIHIYLSPHWMLKQQKEEAL